MLVTIYYKYNFYFHFSKLLEKFSIEEEEEKRKVRSRQNSEMQDELGQLAEIDDEPILEKETQGSGSISGSVYWKYFRAGGNICIIFLLTISFFICQGASNGAEYFVTYWYCI